MGNQESMEHGGCQGKHQGRLQAQLKLHMALMAWACAFLSVSKLSLSVLHQLPLFLIITLCLIDGATGSQSGPGDSAYGESSWPQFPFPLLSPHNQICLGSKQASTLNSQRRHWNSGLLGSKGEGLGGVRGGVLLSLTGSDLVSVTSASGSWPFP